MSDYAKKTDLYSAICKKVNNPAIRSWLGAIIAEQPGADVVLVRHGKWIGYETNSFKNSCEGLKRKFYRCSVCRTANAIRVNYCPNCGAKMDGDINAAD